MFVIVVGGGKIGYYLVKDLIAKGYEVILIERNSLKSTRINNEFGGISICGDACDPRVLEKAGINRANMVIAVTGDDEDNLIICQLAKRKFNVPFTLTRINNPRNKEIFKKLGVDAAVSKTEIILSMIEEEMAYKGLMATLPISGCSVEMIETLITPDSPAVGKMLRELKLPDQCTIPLVIRCNEMIIPDGNTLLQIGDLVITLTKKEKFGDLKLALVGDSMDLT
jgi:trk system potassium uptake protein